MKGGSVLTNLIKRSDFCTTHKKMKSTTRGFSDWISTNIFLMSQFWIEDSVDSFTETQLNTMKSKLFTIKAFLKNKELYMSQTIKMIEIAMITLSKIKKKLFNLETTKTSTIQSLSSLKLILRFNYSLKSTNIFHSKNLIWFTSTSPDHFKSLFLKILMWLCPLDILLKQSFQSN